MKKVIVTGADGFIGSHLVEALVRDNYDVKAFVMYNSFGSWGWLDHINENKVVPMYKTNIKNVKSLYLLILGVNKFIIWLHKNYLKNSHLIQVLKIQLL